MLGILRIHVRNLCRDSMLGGHARILAVDESLQQRLVARAVQAAEERSRGTPRNHEFLGITRNS